MTQDFKQAALEIADLIFDCIEKDRSLIKQNIADVVEKELVFRFQRPEAAPTIVPHIANPGWAPAPDFSQYVPTVTTDNTGSGALLGARPFQYMGGLGGISSPEAQKRQDELRQHVENERHRTDYEKLRHSLAEWKATSTTPD